MKLLESIGRRVFELDRTIGSHFFDIFTLVMKARYEPTVYKSSNNLNLEREIQFVSLERPQLEKAFQLTIFNNMCNNFHFPLFHYLKPLGPKMTYMYHRLIFWMDVHRLSKNSKFG